MGCVLGGPGFAGATAPILGVDCDWNRVLQVSQLHHAPCKRTSPKYCTSTTGPRARGFWRTMDCSSPRPVSGMRIHTEGCYGVSGVWPADQGDRCALNRSTLRMCKQECDTFSCGLPPDLMPLGLEYIFKGRSTPLLAIFSPCWVSTKVGSAHSRILYRNEGVSLKRVGVMMITLRFARRTARVLLVGLGVTVITVLVGLVTSLIPHMSGQTMSSNPGVQRVWFPGQSAWMLVRIGAFIRIVGVMDRESSFRLLDPHMASIVTALPLYPGFERPPMGPVPPDFDQEAWVGRAMYVLLTHRDASNDGEALIADADIPAWLRNRLTVDAEHGVLWQVQVTDGLGWPMAAVTGSMLYAPFTKQPPYFLVRAIGSVMLDDPKAWSRSGLMVAPAPWDVRLLPYMPVFAGLAIDTVFWAVMTEMLCFVTRLVRSGMRRRR